MTAWLAPTIAVQSGSSVSSLDETKTITVRAKLRVIRHRPTVINGTPVEGFTEFRLLNARVMGDVR
jgi:hypothetical protein